MQQWLNMQMCLKASVLCRAVVEHQPCTTVTPHSVFVAATPPRGCKPDARRPSFSPGGGGSHPNSGVTSLSVVVAERKESASCLYQVYSKYDSWTSGYRPQITQDVNSAPGWPEIWTKNLGADSGFPTESHMCDRANSLAVIRKKKKK